MQLAIIGLGLIGASFGAALRHHELAAAISGYDLNPDAARQALKRGHITRIAPDVADAVSGADVVLLAVYVGGIMDLLGQIGPHLKPGALVLDVGSTKSAIVRVMGALPDHVRAVGGHPMTGRATSGVSGADAGLFAGRVFVLTPTPRSQPADLDRAQALVERIGARPVRMDADRHDRIVALISHMSRLIPVAMLATARAHDDPLVWELAAGGFREGTRPASHDLGFWRDVFATNTNGIPAALRALGQQLDRLAAALEAGDIETVEAISQQARADWLARYGDDG